MRPAFTCLVAVLCTLGSLSAMAAPKVRFDFDTDAQGWTVQSGGAMVHKDGDPRHGGYLEITDITDEDFVVLPAAIALGDWSVYLDGSLQFLARNANGDLPDWPLFGQVTVSNGDQSLMLDIVPDNQPPADGKWHRYSTTLSTAVWGADLPAVLANVTNLTIKLEFHAGVTEVVDFDAFKLRRAPR
jgi:hypothetical protein